MADNIYYLSERPLEENNAGSKARVDVERVFEACGYQSLIHMEQVSFASFGAKLRYKASPYYLSKLWKLRHIHGRRLLMQYPFYYDFVTNHCLRSLVARNRTILVVHDVDSLRDFGRESMKTELAVFNNAALLIVHNAKMAKALEERGVHTPMVQLGIFDYLLSDPWPQPERTLSESIAFAGNLRKSVFLKKPALRDAGVRFELYGPGYDDAAYGGGYVNYRGCYPAEEIPYQLQGSFGLIWDGSEVGTCSGAFGEYMRYNNPHKLSLYIAAQLPVIVWKEAAIADFVTEKGIGIVVDSLLEIRERIARLTKEDYNKFVAALRDLQRQIVRGNFMTAAVQSAVQQIFIQE